MLNTKIAHLQIADDHVTTLKLQRIISRVGILNNVQEEQYLLMQQKENPLQQL